MDVGCRLEDYCSDQTRTFWVGEKPTERFKKTLEAVQEAQHRAIRAIHPGVLACDVYKAARGYFESLGVAEAFTHGLGHGVGLETHEGPSLNGRNKTPLEPGMSAKSTGKQPHTVIFSHFFCISLSIYDYQHG